MRILVRLCLIVAALTMFGCGAVEEWVSSASRELPLDPTPGNDDGDDDTPVASTPGYIFSSGGGTVQGSTYKLRLRVGKVESVGLSTGSTYKLRTGKTRHLKDM